jgi:hypothetical protein
VAGTFPWFTCHVVLASCLPATVQSQWAVSTHSLTSSWPIPVAGNNTCCFLAAAQHKDTRSHRFTRSSLVRHLRGNPPRSVQCIVVQQPAPDIKHSYSLDMHTSTTKQASSLHNVQKSKTKSQPAACAVLDQIFGASIPTVTVLAIGVHPNPAQTSQRKEEEGEYSNTHTHTR